MIKSSKLSIHFANTGKQSDISGFIDDYHHLMNQFVDMLWNMDSIPVLLPKELTDQVNTPLSARAIQCACKQASGIIRGTKRKQEKRMWMANKLHEEGKHKQARKLEAIINKKACSKPILDNVNPELDSRFIKMDFDNSTSFDGIITLSSLYKNTKISIPVKKTRHLNRLLLMGSLRPGIRLNKKYLTLMIEIPDVKKRVAGEVLGIDIGQSSVISCSNGFQFTTDPHGHSLKSICDRLARKQKGSRGFNRTQTHRTNFVNHSINQLDLTGIKEVRIENIKHMRKGRTSSRSLSHWTYTEIVDKIEAKCIDSGVQVKPVAPTYTSQRCSVCGWTRKTNRRQKQFRCGSCGHTMDSDLNASINISLDLKPLGKRERLERINKTGFYWLARGQEPIVPDVPGTYSNK